MKKSLFIAGAVLATGLSTFAQTTNTIALWTFETTAPTTAGPISPETGSGSALGLHASGSAVYSSPAGNGSAKSYSANFWGVNDYWQFQVSTVGFSGIQLSYGQNGSSTGPSKFQLAYSTDGTSFFNFGSVYTLPSGVTWSATVPNSATTFSYDLSSITDLDNSSTVYFRLIDQSTTSINGGTVGTGGTDRVDNINVFTVTTPVPEPSTLALLGLGGAGLLALRRRKD